MTAHEPRGLPTVEPGDFTATPRLVLLALIGCGLGVLSAYLSVWLLSLINACTNLFFFQRLSTAPASPANHTARPWVILVPVAGALIIGLMARYGSERIRGHGIPEAIEAILINGSRVEPKLAVLKPLSAAISIGSGGPFGAEGPIIMTGGAFGSLIAQFFHLSSAERKTLLVAGAAAGMSATFATPLAAVLLAVELLLFEWKPRSFIPVALASATAAAARRYLVGVGPLFPVPPHPVFIGPAGLAGCVLAGIARRCAVTRCSPAPSTRRRRVSAPAGALDVVAGYRRPRHRHRRPDLPAGARRRLRHHRRPAAAARAAARLAGHPAGEVVDLGRRARLRHLGWRAGAAADDGRRARRARSAVSPGLRGAGSGR